MMEGLVCKDIIKKYGKKTVLDQVDLSPDHGKIYGLIGRNGAGKTTLLSIMTAQNPATSGEVTCDGLPVWENPRALDKICFSRELNPMSGMSANSMKVKEYLKIASIYFPNWDPAMADRLTRLFQLDVKKRICKLSKGMMSMVTIIVALASKAEFTLLDEPVAGLDVVAREQFYQILLEEFNDTGRTFLISTHIIEEAANVFEEVIMIDKGRILLKENTEELLEKCVYVSGRDDEVDAAVRGLETHHAERIGRGKLVMAYLKEGQSVDDSRDVDIRPMTLQQVFVALCGEEEHI